MIKVTFMASIVIMLVILSGYGLHLSIKDRYEVDDFVTQQPQSELNESKTNYTVGARNIFSDNEKTSAEQHGKKNLASPSARTVDSQASQKLLGSDVEPTVATKNVISGAKYLGHIVKSGQVKAFVVFNDKRLVVGVGDFISSQFRVIEISQNLVKLQREPTDIIHILYLDGGGE